MLPHSGETKKDRDSFLDELSEVLKSNRATLKTSDRFFELYKSTLAIDCCLEKFSGDNGANLDQARVAARAVLSLVTTGHQRAAFMELRRTIEASVHGIYFQDHPIEYARLEQSPRNGFCTDKTTPIEWAAFREFSYYANYAKERMLKEPSALGTDAVGKLATEYSNSSFAVHASPIPHGGMFPEDMNVTQSNLTDISTRARRVFGACALAVAAVRVSKFDSLPPIHRGWFDWLIGKSTAKQLRSGPFGLGA